VPFKPAFEDEFFDVVGNSGLFQFDIQQASGSEFVQHIGEPRDRAAESRIELGEFVVS